jgi:chromate transporter
VSPLVYFWLFFKASLFSFGGLGNLPFLHKDLLGLGWAKESDFVTAIAVGNISPGPTGLWTISLGYLTYGWLGSILATVALAIPPLLVLIVSAFYNRIEKLPQVQNFTRGLVLGVVGLTLTVALGLARSSIVDWRGILVAMVALGLALTKKVPIIVILALAAVFGCLVYGL